MCRGPELITPLDGLTGMHIYFYIEVIQPCLWKASSDPYKRVFRGREFPRVDTGLEVTDGEKRHREARPLGPESHSKWSMGPGLRFTSLVLETWVGKEGARSRPSSHPFPLCTATCQTQSGCCCRVTDLVGTTAPSHCPPRTRWIPQVSRATGWCSSDLGREEGSRI